jgi:hypothetical protein
VSDVTIKVIDLDDCGCGCGGGDPHDAAVSEALLFEASMLDATDQSTAEPICGSPISLQVERLKKQLADHFGYGFSVVSTDLYGLEDGERNVAIDAVVAGKQSPFVLVGDQLVCAGSVELPAILEALAPADTPTPSAGH